MFCKNVFAVGVLEITVPKRVKKPPTVFSASVLSVRLSVPLLKIATPSALIKSERVILRAKVVFVTCTVPPPAPGANLAALVIPAVEPLPAATF